MALLSPIVVWLAMTLVVGVMSGDWTAFSRFGQVAELPGVTGLTGWLVWILTFGLGGRSGLARLRPAPVAGDV